MRCAVSAAKPAACSALLLLGAVIVTGFGTRAARADDPEPAAPARSWCVARGEAQPTCGHVDPLSCGIAALFTGGYCVREEPAPVVQAVTVATAPPRPKRTAARRKPPASQQDELFKEFEQWKRTSAK